jgi:hypothetical protein
MNKDVLKLLYIFFYLLISSSVSFGQQYKYFQIKVVDDQTNRGVPLVELRTTNQISYYTDNNGIIAFNEPDLMNQEVYFSIKSHGYEYPADAFGYRGKLINIVPGDSTVIKIKRTNIAERLYRVTGEGLFNDSQLLGFPIPLKQTFMNGKVMGQDTFIETLYKGKIFWLWGDTDRPSYPLGNYSTTGATSELPMKGGLDPGIGINLTYFTDKSGNTKKMCIVKGPGPVWMHWLVVIKDSMDNQRLIGSYTRVKSLGVNYEQGLALFNDSTDTFEPFVRFKLNSPLFPDGHAFRATVNGLEYIYFDFNTPYLTRVLADWNHIKNLSDYEGYTCLKEGSQFDSPDIKIDRTNNDKLIYQWKKNTEPLNADKEKVLLKNGKLKSGETILNLCDFLTGKPVVSKSGSVFWNAFRCKWVMVFEQVNGTSILGEVWYAEGDTPTGPWVYARKIVTHDNYTFYNVGQHPLFDQDNGRIIYFEGTYTDTFSGNRVITPRYNYNQMMYRLNLDDSRLYLPSPVYCVKDNKTNFRYLMRNGIDSLNIWRLIQEIPFFALPPDRSIKGLIPVYAVREKGKTRLQVVNPDAKVKPLFYGIPDSKLIVATPVTPDGTWDCKADELSLRMELHANGTLIEGTTSDKSLIIKKGSLLKDTIELFIEDIKEHRNYIVRARLTAGNISGEYRDIKDNLKGVFSGKQNEFNLQQLSSPMVVPLYEFKDHNGFYTYSVKSELEGLKRTETPVCRVWENPSSLLPLDFEAKPLPFIR